MKQNISTKTVVRHDGHNAISEEMMGVEKYFLKWSNN